MRAGDGQNNSKGEVMRTFVVVICSLALVSVGYAQREENKPQKKKQQPQTVQHAAPATTGHPTGARAGAKKPSTAGYQPQKGQGQMGANQGQKGKKQQAPMATHEVKKGQPQ